MKVKEKKKKREKEENALESKQRKLGKTDSGEDEYCSIEGGQRRQRLLNKGIVLTLKGERRWKEREYL